LGLATRHGTQGRAEGRDASNRNTAWISLFFAIIRDDDPVAGPITSGTRCSGRLSVTDTVLVEEPQQLGVGTHVGAPEASADQV
jgi:hypothetical protein